MRTLRRWDRWEGTCSPSEFLRRACRRFPVRWRGRRSRTRRRLRAACAPLRGMESLPACVSASTWWITVVFTIPPSLVIQSAEWRDLSSLRFPFRRGHGRGREPGDPTVDPIGAKFGKGSPDASANFKIEFFVIRVGDWAGTCWSIATIPLLFTNSARCCLRSHSRRALWSPSKTQSGPNSKSWPGVMD